MWGYWEFSLIVEIKYNIWFSNIKPNWRNSGRGSVKKNLQTFASSKEKIVADSNAGINLVVATIGNIYVTSPNGIEMPARFI